MAEYSKTVNLNKDIERKKAESVGHHVFAKGERCQNLNSKPQSCGDT